MNDPLKLALTGALIFWYECSDTHPSDLRRNDDYRNHF
jgi:hypothetical protein